MRTKKERVKVRIKERVRKYRRKSAAAALLAALLLLAPSLSSCSVVQINLDKIFPPESIGTSDIPYGTSYGTSDAGITESDGYTSENSGDAAGDKNDTPLEQYEFNGFEIAAKYLDEIDCESFGGGSVFIRTTSYVMQPSINAEENESSFYSAAVFKRNQTAEEKLGCKLHFILTTLDEMRVDMAAAQKNEEYYADLLAVTQSELAVLASDGLLMNLRSLPFFDFTEEYFNYSSVEALTAGYYTYGIASAATLTPDDIPCVFINNKTVSEHYDGSLEACVKAGNFTWDTLLTISESASGAGADAGTLVCSELDGDSAALLISVSGGLRFTENEYKETPSVRLPEPIHEAVDVCRRLIAPDINDLDEADGEANIGSEADVLSRFISGESAFYIGTLGDMNALGNSPLDFGLAPIPKLSYEQTEYYTAAPYDGMILAVPAKMTNPDGASALIRVLSAASFRYLRDAYVEYHMYHTVRHIGTLDMIELVYESVHYDFAYIFGENSKALRDASFMLIYEAAMDPDFDPVKQFSRRDGTADNALKKAFEPRN